MTAHELLRSDTPEQAAVAAAEVIAHELAARLARAGTSSLAVSGGSSPLPMFAHLAGSGTAWDRVDVFQVDERVAGDGDAARNLTGLRARLTPDVVPTARLHAMAVGLGADDAATEYCRTLERVLGAPPAIDVVHLGLGDDGHTASLVSGDPALDVHDRDVVATGDYRGHRRVTLTYPALDRAGLVVWLVTGADKRDRLAQLLAGDRSIPAGRVAAVRSVVCCDAAADPGPSARPPVSGGG